VPRRPRTGRVWLALVTPLTLHDVEFLNTPLTCSTQC
jgi:hypothetical protein